MDRELIEEQLYLYWGPLCRRAGKRNVDYLLSCSAEARQISIDQAPGGADMSVLDVVLILKGITDILMTGYKLIAVACKKGEPPPSEEEFIERTVAAHPDVKPTSSDKEHLRTYYQAIKKKLAVK